VLGSIGTYWEETLGYSITTLGARSPAIPLWLGQALCT